jgi:hypothetical protein
MVLIADLLYVRLTRGIVDRVDGLGSKLKGHSNGTLGS